MVPDRLLREGIINKGNIFAPEAAGKDILSLTHSPEYIERVAGRNLTIQEIRRIGFPLTEEFVKREFLITGGTIECIRHAEEKGVSFNFAGGTHHAFRNRGEAFCIFNDVAAAANYLIFRNPENSVVIIDLDAHQGNGTAEIFSGREEVFTFSMHMEKGYPLRKTVSDLDISLKKGTGDSDYIKILEKHLDEILNRKFGAAFYIAGADVAETDSWGEMALSSAGVMARDELVFSRLKSAGIPVVVTMGGGYSKDINTIVDIHCNTFRMAAKIYG